MNSCGQAPMLPADIEAHAFSAGATTASAAWSVAAAGLGTPGKPVAGWIFETAMLSFERLSTAAKPPADGLWMAP